LTYLQHELAERDKVSHQIPGVWRYYVGEIAANIFRCGAHGGFNSIPRRIHKQLREPFEYHLNLLRIGLEKVVDGEWYANVVYAPRNNFIWLDLAVSRELQSHEV
jgi:hypothetical protein